MTLDDALELWATKTRRMGCVSASQWLCSRVPGFTTERLTRHTAEGELFEHVVANRDGVRVDLASYADVPA